MTSPSLQTVKRLFADSGNVCAFAECSQALVVGETVVGDICHICAANPGGARFDVTQSDEERASYENLVLMCPTHHRVIDADVATYTVDAIKQLKQLQSSSAKSQPQINDGLAQVALQNSGIVIGSVSDSVVSINQQGGITAHTVNQAPAPELKILSQSNSSEGQWSKTKIVVEVIAPYPVANLYLEAHSDEIEEFDVAPMRSGIASFGLTGKRPGFCFTNVQQAHGKYTLTARSKSKVELRYDFD